MSTKHVIVTKSQIEVLRANAVARGNQRMVDACSMAMWNVDHYGNLDGYHTSSGDYVRCAVIASIDAGEIAPTESQRVGEPRWRWVPLPVV